MNRHKNESSSLAARLKSFKYAFEGLKVLIKDECNFRIHTAISIFVCILGIILNISYLEWIAIVIFIAIVIGMEIINSVIERICDHMSPDWHINIKQIKDMMAAGVLLTAISAVVGGLIIFLPKLFCLFF